MITFDEIVAFDTPNFQQEYDRLVATLTNLITTTTFEQSTYYTVIPIAQNLLIWLQKFEDNMRTNNLRTYSVLRSRICFAENGMKLTLALGVAIQKECDMLKNFIHKSQIITTETQTTQQNKKREREIVQTTDYLDVKQERETLQLLVTTWINVLQIHKKGLCLMYNWLMVIVDMTPQSYKALNTVLTQKNLNYLRILYNGITDD